MRGYCWTPSSSLIPKPDAHRLAGDAMTAGASRACVRLDVELPLIFPASPVPDRQQLQILRDHVRSIAQTKNMIYFRPSWLPPWMTDGQAAYVGEIKVVIENGERVIRGSCWFDNPHYDDPSKASPADGTHAFNPDDAGLNGAVDREMIRRGTWWNCKTPDRPEIRRPPNVDSDKLAACIAVLAQEFGDVVDFFGFGNEPDIANFWPDIMNDGVNGGDLGDTLAKYMRQIVLPAINAWLKNAARRPIIMLPDAATTGGLARCVDLALPTFGRHHGQLMLATGHIYPWSDDYTAGVMKRTQEFIEAGCDVFTEADGSIENLLFLVEYLKSKEAEIEGPFILDPRLLVDGFEGDSPVMNANGQRMRDLVARLDGVLTSANHGRAAGK